MALEIEVMNEEEFEQLITDRDVRISDALVNTIFKNLKSKKRHHHALSVTCRENEITYDVTIDKKDFKKSLLEVLPRYEKNERFEVCQKIKESIEYLDSKK